MKVRSAEFLYTSGNRKSILAPVCIIFFSACGLKEEGYVIMIVYVNVHVWSFSVKDILLIRTVQMEEL